MKTSILILLTSFIPLFFNACSEKTHAMRYFDEASKKSVKSIQYTKKVDLTLDGQNEVSIIATYLNKIDKNYDNKQYETFLVAIQVFNNFNLFKDRFEIQLNEIMPLSYEKIENNSELLKKISLKNHWAKYYLVRFDALNKNNKSLNLTISHSRLGEALIGFEK